MFVLVLDWLSGFRCGLFSPVSPVGSRWRKIVVATGVVSEGRLARNSLCLVFCLLDILPNGPVQQNFNEGLSVNNFKFMLCKPNLTTGQLTFLHLHVEVDEQLFMRELVLFADSGRQVGHFVRKHEVGAFAPLERDFLLTVNQQILRSDCLNRFKKQFLPRLFANRRQQQK